MNEKIIRIVKNNIFGFLVGAILFSGIGAYAATVYLASNIQYKDDKTVETALNELYDKAKDFTKVTATAGNVSSGYKFYNNKGELVTGTKAESTSISNPLVGSSVVGFSSGTTTETKMPITINNSNYISVSNNIITIKKAGNYTMSLAVGSNRNNANGCSYNGMVSLYINNQQQIFIYQSYDAMTTNANTFKLNVGDTVYAAYSGNGGSYPKKASFSMIVS